MTDDTNLDWYRRLSLVGLRWLLDHNSDQRAVDVTLRIVRRLQDVVEPRLAYCGF